MSSPTSLSADHQALYAKAVDLLNEGKAPEASDILSARLEAA